MMFTWDLQKAIINSAKHRVPFEKAVTVFSDPDGLEWEDVKHSYSEHRWKRIGASIEGRVLIVVYTVRRVKDGKEAIRIISARQANRKERQAYAG